MRKKYSKYSVDALESRVLLTVQLAADINTDTLGSNPRGFAPLGDKAIFFAQQTNGQYALWKTDGSSNGTSVVKGDLGNIPIDGFGPVEADGKVFFQTSPSAQQFQVLVTDGTPQGTQMLKSVRPGFPVSMGTPAEYVAFGGRVFLNATDASGTELWSSDGTPGGTGLFADIVPGATSANVRALTVSGSYLYFKATENNLDSLWRTDGTLANTVRLCQLSRTSSIDAVSLNSKLYFFAGGVNEFPDQLWVSDGTPEGTQMVKDLSTPDSLAPTQLKVMGGALYFSGPINGSLNTTLWRSDGTPDGTLPLIVNPPANFTPSGLIGVGNQLFFNASDQADGRELWISDGTTAGTHLFRDLNPGAGNGILSPVSVPVPAPGGIYFFATNGVSGEELWFSDGSQSPAGTFMVKDLYPGSRSSFVTGAVTLPDGRLIFGAQTPDAGNEPFVSDMTTAGTHVLVDIETRSAGSSPTEIISANNSILVAAVPPVLVHDSNSLQALMAVNPATSAVSYVLPFAIPTSGDSAKTGRGQYSYVAFHGNIYFFSPSDQGVPGASRLYRSDGTSEGTQTFGAYYSPTYDVVVMGNMLYFTAMVGSTISGGVAVYRTDGTVAGTQVVSPPNSQKAAHLSVSGSNLYFAMNTDLYRISNNDGVATRIGGTGGTVNDVMAVGTRVFFRRTFGSSGAIVLGATDDGGAGIGTALIQGDGLTAYKGKLYFREASTGALYQSDGTAQGTRPLLPNGKIVRPYNLRVVDNDLYFVADDGIHGSEWWRTDGTDAGTTLWVDMQPGPDGSDPADAPTIDRDFERTIVSWRGSIYFDAQVDGTGAELWRMDAGGGTPKLVADLYPGTTSSDPTALTVIGDNLYLIATRPDVGRELFRVVDDVAPTVVAAAFDPAGSGKIAVDLSESVAISNGGGFPQLMNRATGDIVPSDNFSESYDDVTHSVKIVPTKPLADGDYRLTLPVSYLKDGAGNSLGADYSFDFFVLAGDATRDRRVGFGDLVALAQNYGGEGKTYAQGDLNGDGSVNFADLVVVAQNYGNSLTPLAPAASPTLAAGSASHKAPVVSKAIFSAIPVAKPAASSRIIRPKRLT